MLAHRNFFKLNWYLSRAVYLLSLRVPVELFMM